MVRTRKGRCKTDIFFRQMCFRRQPRDESGEWMWQSHYSSLISMTPIKISYTLPFFLSGRPSEDRRAQMPSNFSLHWAGHDQMTCHYVSVTCPTCPTPFRHHRGCWFTELRQKHHKLEGLFKLLNDVLVRLNIFFVQINHTTLKQLNQMIIWNNSN